MFKPHLLFFIISLYWALVSADYTIDDSDYSILKFSENPSGPVWGPFGSDTGEVLEIRLPNGTTQTVDATQCFDGTYTYAACTAKDNCVVQFSFTGSGITIYVLRAGPQGMSASLSIDSGAPTTATLDVAPQYYIPHAVLFDVQNIPSGTHSAVMTVQNWKGGFSGMMLDYINVNQAQVLGTSQSSSPSSSHTSSSSTQSSTQFSTTTISNTQSGSQPTGSTTAQTSSAPVSSGVILSASPSSMAASPSQSGNGTSTAISSRSTTTDRPATVGGIIGGVGGFLALLGLILFCLRRQRRKERDPLPSPRLEARFMEPRVPVRDPFLDTTTLSTSQTTHVPSARFRSLQSWTASEANSGPNLATNPSFMNRVSHMRDTSTRSNSATSSVPVPHGPMGEATAMGTAGTATMVATRPDWGAPSSGSSERLVARPADDGSGGGSGGSEYPNEKAGLVRSDGAQQEDAGVLGTRPDPLLMNGQADSADTLSNNSVPASVVSRMFLERALSYPQGTGFGGPELRPRLSSVNFSTSPQARGWHAESEMGDGETSMGTAPPSYDFVQGHK